MNVFPKLATVLFSIVFFWDGVAIGADAVTVANPPVTIAQAQDDPGTASRKPAATGKKADSPYDSAREKKDAKKDAPKALDPCRMDPSYPGCSAARDPCAMDPDYPGCPKAKAKPAE